MLEDFKKEKTLVRILLLLLITAIGIYLFNIVWQALSNFADIIIIMVTAWLLSFILDPLAGHISKYAKTSKLWAALLTYTLIFGLLIIGFLLFIPTVQEQITTLIRLLPRYLAHSPGFINRWGDTLILYLNNSISLVPSVATFLFDVFLILIFSFYFVVDKDNINKELFLLIPKNWHKTMRFSQQVIDNTFASFLRVQVIFGIIAGIVTWIVLHLFAIQYADSTALLSGIFTIIPLIGPILALLPPVLIIFITNSPNAILIFLILLAAQQIIFNVLGPKLLGNAFKVHPAIILLSFLIGVKIAGPAGAVFAVPVVGILTIAIREIRKTHWKYSENLTNL